MNIKSTLIISALLIFSLSSVAQNYSWKVKASYPAAGNAGVAVFAINGKGYYFGGFNSTGVSTSETWEYDPAADTWTQKASFAGNSRVSASGFAIGNDGYVCCGWNYNSPGVAVGLSDLWQYSPPNNAWVQKTIPPAQARYNAVAFVIGNKAYFGFGYAPFYSDFYEYDASNDTWTALMNQFPGVARSTGISFAVTYTDQFANIVTKGFVGSGSSADNLYSQLDDFYSFTPGTTAGSGTWASVAPIPGGRIAPFAFTINDKGYVGGGVANSIYLNDFYEYDPALDTWTPRQNYPYYAGAVKGFTIGNIGYAGTGSDGTGNLSVFYEYSPGTLGVKELNTENYKLFYLNGKVHIVFKQELESESEFSLYDLSGRLQSKENINSHTKEIIFDYPRKNNGIYLYTISAGNELAASGRVAMID